MNSARKAFSLIELLVVLGVLALLVALSLPAIQSARNAASRLDCQNRLKQTALAIHNHTTTLGHFPLYVRLGKQVDNGTRSKTYTWMLELQPYLEGDSIYRSADAAFETAAGWQDPPHQYLSHVVKTYACPADLNAQSARSDGRFTAAYASYCGVMGYMRKNQMHRGLFLSSNVTRPADITDGMSQTIIIGESPSYGRELGGAWYTSDMPFDLLWTTFPWRTGTWLFVEEDPAYDTCRGRALFGPGRVDNPCDSFHFYSVHGGGANFAMGDGSVRWFAYSAAPLLPALSTIAGGEPTQFE